MQKPLAVGYLHEGCCLKAARTACTCGTTLPSARSLREPTRGSPQEDLRDHLFERRNRIGLVA
eukprot:scaffold1299_cov385-Pavlova_lutheri.AAC.15